jgi:hypothetical protein
MHMFDGHGQLVSPEGDMLCRGPRVDPERASRRRRAVDAERLPGASWTLTHAAVNSNSATAQTASELLLATIALSGTTTVNIGQSFLYTLRWTQQ